MKKICLFLSIAALSLASCSSDSESSTNNPSSDVLVKKIVYTSLMDDYTETINFTYNGNKLVKGIYSDGSQETYTYQGDLITKIVLSVDGEDDMIEDFTYDSSGRLTGYYYQEGVYTEQETFVYNSDGTVTGTIGTGSEAVNHTYHFSNGELVKIVNNMGQTYNYTYDAKNSPFKNVTGYGNIAMVTTGDHEFFGRSQNIVSIHETSGDVNYMANTMTYNAANYPLTADSVADFGSGAISHDTMVYTYN